MSMCDTPQNNNNDRVETKLRLVPYLMFRGHNIFYILLHLLDYSSSQNNHPPR
jgi:hypothetical protein